MAAGSVIKEPRRGTNDIVTKKSRREWFMGNNFEICLTHVKEKSNIGLLAAITIITKTNNGST